MDSHGQRDGQHAVQCADDERPAAAYRCAFLGGDGVWTAVWELDAHGGADGGDDGERHDDRDDNREPGVYRDEISQTGVPWGYVARTYQGHGDAGEPVPARCGDCGVRAHLLEPA